LFYLWSGLYVSGILGGDGALTSLTFQPWDINNMRRSVGYTRYPNPFRAILQDEAGPHNIDGPLGFAPYGLNESNHIVGCNYPYAYLRSPDGTFTQIEYPNASLTCTWGINDSGQIVGSHDSGAFLDLSR
jgi:hypothetical protein